MQWAQCVALRSSVHDAAVYRELNVQPNVSNFLSLGQMGDSGTSTYCAFEFVLTKLYYRQFTVPVTTFDSTKETQARRAERLGEGYRRPTRGA